LAAHATAANLSRFRGHPALSVPRVASLAPIGSLARSPPFHSFARVPGFARLLGGWKSEPEKSGKNVENVVVPGCWGKIIIHVQ
jgi:hypothetical protein